MFTYKLIVLYFGNNEKWTIVKTKKYSPTTEYFEKVFTDGAVNQSFCNMCPETERDDNKWNNKYIYI